jgi:hypothetical protein
MIPFKTRHYSLQKNNCFLWFLSNAMTYGTFLMKNNGLLLHLIYSDISHLSSLLPLHSFSSPCFQPHYGMCNNLSLPTHMENLLSLHWSSSLMSQSKCLSSMNLVFYQWSVFPMNSISFLFSVYFEYLECLTSHWTFEIHFQHIS